MEEKLKEVLIELILATQHVDEIPTKKVIKKALDLLGENTDV